MTAWFSMLYARHAVLKLVATMKWIPLPFGCSLQRRALKEQDENYSGLQAVREPEEQVFAGNCWPDASFRRGRLEAKAGQVRPSPDLQFRTDRTEGRTLLVEPPAELMSRA